MNLSKGRRSEVAVELDGKFAFGQGTWRLLISRDRKPTDIALKLTRQAATRRGARLVYLALAVGKADQHTEKKGVSQKAKKIEGA